MSWKDRLLELLGFGQKPGDPAAESPAEREAQRTVAPVVPRRRMTAIIGLDFGTSCTKCVVGVAGRAIAVRFADLTRPDTPYLLPTQLWFGVDRSLSLRKTANAQPVTGMKVGLMERADAICTLTNAHQATPVQLSAAYMGEVLRYVRTWLLAEKRDLIGDAELIWELNVGLPAKSHDNKIIHDAFTRAAYAGWALSQRNGTMYLGVAAEAIRVVSADTSIVSNATAIQLIPEVAAEVVGYARSAQRREGPHMMVDVGATTLDVCLFNLAETGDGHEYAFFATDVRTDLGALRLHTKRLLAIDSSSTGTDLETPLRPIPKSWRQYPGANGPAEAVDRQFREEAEGVVRRTASQAKQKQRSGLVVEVERVRGLERVRDGEIRVLMCGGGSAIPLYEGAVRGAAEKLCYGRHGSLGLKPFRIVPGLEVPRRLDAPQLPKKDFHRIAVAYGLSYSVDNIGRYTPPSELQPEPRWWATEFEDRRPEND
jgi:hypothetical protein